MDDVRKWRLENTNKEKKTDKKAFNSWVANKRKEEYQVDLFFFQDLKKKLALKELMEERAKGGDEEAKAALDADIPVRLCSNRGHRRCQAKSKGKSRAKVVENEFAKAKGKGKGGSKGLGKIQGAQKDNQESVVGV
jgi:hypothetical protein